MSQNESIHERLGRLGCTHRPYCKGELNPVHAIYRNGRFVGNMDAQEAAEYCGKLEAGA
jgi:hypothetical protein